MAVQKSQALAGITKQTAKGSAPTAVTFQFGIAGGNPLQANLEQEADEVTSGSRTQPFVIRKSAIPGAEFEGRMYPKSIGLLLYAALGAISTSGAGPYVHTITPGATLPYLGFWAKYGGNWYLTQDAKIDELEISWDGPGPVSVKAKALGTIITFPSTPTITNDEVGTQPMGAGGGTFKFDTDSATPVTGSITGGTITIKNTIEPILLAASIAPDDQFESGIEIEHTLKVIPTDLADWRILWTGTSGGTTVSQSPIYGSFEHTFNQGAAICKLASANTAFTVDFPEADPKGGPAELELKGVCVGTSLFTATVTNTQTTY